MWGTSRFHELTVARPAAHALDGPDADLPEAQHQQAGEGAQDLPLFVARAGVERPNQV